ncbi:diguanylate cyclase (GGDEF)-like protein [Plasticicumulans lactativorans]|uniref:Diguanylate cyclase (GGDEF)-like protein n=1 Tax=Plasticicumulans lactativorans TaxID=1133106 RepID=A0A4R2L9B7_9GAMM|nr:EAL domain-containing protein [Plasticicumulans lactativorans]TCO80726.1 diguanylate cyclase (GGDEF)-like protein [Plasticicumulans lactativorans]
MDNHLTDTRSVILIVEDQPADLLILGEAVGDLAEVHLAKDGRSALGIARACRPDLVLLDIEMPGASGFDICRAMKADPELCNASILFVTCHTRTEIEIKALEHGGVDFIQKPLNIPVVRAHVRAHLSLRTEAKKLAYYDALTGLPNRTLLKDRTEQALWKARRDGTQVAMLLLDLDNFKGINESVGHTIGDAVLKEVAARLRRSSRAIDTVSRPGGDEFVILLPDVKRIDAIGDCVERLLAAIASPIRIEGNRYDLSASAGIGVYPDDSDDLESLYRHADAAMYQAKQDGRHRYRFFSHNIEASSRARLLLERRMRDALERDAFEVFYQAKFDARSGITRGMEALIRWRDESGTFIPPAEFIPLAEKNGLIVPIGRYVLLQACRDARRLLQRGLPVCVSVNISAVQFREEPFLAMVERILDETTLPPALLELEITEGVLAHDIDAAGGILGALKALGVRVSIDDFGTGYSSLTYLKRLPIDVLKIDRSFVRDMLTDSSDAAIIEAIIRLGQALGLELVAEGVETEAQAEKLLARGCAVMQGYHFCMPMPFEQICQRLQTAMAGAAVEPQRDDAR